MPNGYRASKNPDGTWNIHDVPVFASNRLRKVEVTKDWQEKAVAKAKTRAAEVGHIPPLHENHTGGAAPVVNVGKFMPTRVGTLRTVAEDSDGALVVRDEAATYADFLQIPEAHYQRIKRGELPYVSVEAGLSDHEFHGAALLPSAPAIKTPPIQIASEEPATLVAAYSAEGAGVRAVVRFAAPGAAIMDEAKKDDEVEGAKAPEKSAVAEKAPEAPAAEAKPAEAQQGNAEQMTLLLGRMAQLESAVAALTAASQRNARAEVPANPGAPATAPSPTPYAAETSTASSGITPEQFGALTAKVDMLDAEIKRRDEASAREAKVREIVRGLAAEGFAVAPTAESDLVKMAGDKGMVAVEAYAAAWREKGRKAPPASVEDALEAPADPGMTEAFGKYGPSIEPHVAKFSAAYDALNGATSLDRVAFVRANLRSLRLIKD